MNKPKLQIVKLPKNLTWKDAYRLLKSKKVRDFRGMKYNPVSGIARLI